MDEATEIRSMDGRLRVVVCPACGAELAYPRDRADVPDPRETAAQ
jgi:hypothetical protein